MPPYRVKRTPEFANLLDSWTNVPPSVVRALCNSLVDISLVDILEHQSAFAELRSVPGGHLLNIDVEPFASMVFVTHRDKNFRVHHAVYERSR